MSEEAESDEGAYGDTGRAFVLALIPLILLLLLGLSGPLIQWVLLQNSLPVSETDRQIAALFFSGYLEDQYGLFLLVVFGATAGGGAGVTWLVMRRPLNAIINRKFLHLEKSGLRFLILVLISTVAAFSAANVVAILAGATTGFVIPFGYFSSFALGLWTGATAGVCAFGTAMAVLALYRWGLGRVPDPGFPRAFFASGERRLIELKPRLTPFLLRVLAPGYVFVFFFAIFALSSGGSLAVMRAFALLFGIPLAFFVGVLLLVSLVRWRATYYAVTDRRIMSVTGLVGHAFHDMRHGKRTSPSPRTRSRSGGGTGR
ncbi:MAG: hypothetical protein ACE5I4_01015 [Thermoplasmata archaeon]